MRGVARAARRVGGLRTGVFGALVLILLLASGPVPASTSGPVPSPSQPLAVPAPSGFAERAGYSMSVAEGATHRALAQGSQEVVVTFRSRSPSLFVPPAPGAAHLTLSEIANRFGLTPAEYSAAEQYFVGRGLTVVHTWPDRLSLSLAGSAAALDAAFGTVLETGSYSGRPVVYPATPPTLPAPLQAEVEGVVGLRAGFTSFSYPAVLPSAGGANLVTPAIARDIYDLSGLYNFTGVAKFSSGLGIALLLWGPGYAPADLQTFYSQDYPSNFPSVSIVPTPVDGAPLPSSSATSDPCNTAQELTLDLEWSGSMAPGSTLYPVYAPEGKYPNCSPSSSAMSDALHTAINLPVAAISMSFGAPESTDSGLAATWETYFAEAAQLGITLLAATGDTGGDTSANPCSGVLAPEYPATSPYVVAVGGTDVTLQRNLIGQVQGFTEAAWSDSGGGVSTQFPPPAWQVGLGYSGRATPDVSATAAENSFYYNGGEMVAGGTSFATPLWAGLVTEMYAQYGKPLPSVAPRLYAVGEEELLGGIGTGIADITSGSTCIGTAGPGYDLETGWGTPRGATLFADLTKTIVRLSVSVSTDAVGPGGSVTISAHLANRTTGNPIAGVPVEVTFSSASNLGPCAGTFASGTPVTDASGNVNLSASVPWCFLGSSAVARVLVLANGYYGTNSTSVPVNLLGWFPGLGVLTQFPLNVIGFLGIFAAASLLGYAVGRPPRRPRAFAGEPPPVAPSGPPNPVPTTGPGGSAERAPAPAGSGGPPAPPPSGAESRAGPSQTT